MRTLTPANRNAPALVILARTHSIGRSLASINPSYMYAHHQLLDDLLTAVGPDRGMRNEEARVKVPLDF